MRIYLTGGTGFVGSHVAEIARCRGYEIRALARPAADTGHLESIGAQIVRGDLKDPRSLRAGLEGCDLVIHAVAKVADWGRWKDYYEQTVLASRHLYNAAVDAGVPRAMYVSSVAVYGKVAPIRRVVDEAMGPIPLHRMPRWYYYGRAKSLAETLAMEYNAAGLLKMSVIRPGWIYGPRDRNSLPRLFRAFEQGTVRCIGRGSNALTLTYVSDVAQAVLLAALEEEAVGKAFNVCNDEQISQRQYLDALADMFGVPRVTKSVPYRSALAIAAAMETYHRCFGIRKRPFVTRQAVMLLAPPQTFTSCKIRERLGWTPRVDFDTAMERIKAWWAGKAPPSEPALPAGSQLI